MGRSCPVPRVKSPNQSDTLGHPTTTNSCVILHWYSLRRVWQKSWIDWEDFWEIFFISPILIPKSHSHYNILTFSLNRVFFVVGISERLDVGWHWLGADQWLVVFHLAMVLSAWQQPAAAAAEAAACRRLLQSAVQRPSAAPRLHPPFLLLLLRPYLLLPPLD